MKSLRGWFERRQEHRSAGGQRDRRSRPGLESLESRVVLYSATGNAWMNPAVITISFMPDGTNLGGATSNLQLHVQQQPRPERAVAERRSSRPPSSGRSRPTSTSSSSRTTAPPAAAGTYQEGDPELRRHPHRRLQLRQHDPGLDASSRRR